MSTKWRSWSWTAGDSRGSMPLSTPMGPHWRRCKLQVPPLYTSLTIWNVPPTQSGEEGNASSTSGGWRNVALLLRHSQTLTDAQLRASSQAVSLPGTATAWLSRGWCGLPNASPGAHCLPSRTPTGRPKRPKNIKDINHLNHSLFTPLSSRRWGTVQLHQSWDRETENQLPSEGRQTVK